MATTQPNSTDQPVPALPETKRNASRDDAWLTIFALALFYGWCPLGGFIIVIMQIVEAFQRIH